MVCFIDQSSLPTTFPPFSPSQKSQNPLGGGPTNPQEHAKGKHGGGSGVFQPRFSPEPSRALLKIWAEKPLNPPLIFSFGLGLGKPRKLPPNGFWEFGALRPDHLNVWAVFFSLAFVHKKVVPDFVSQRVPMCPNVSPPILDPRCRVPFSPLCPVVSQRAVSQRVPSNPKSNPCLPICVPNFVSNFVFQILCPRFGVPDFVSRRVPPCPNVLYPNVSVSSCVPFSPLCPVVSQRVPSNPKVRLLCPLVSHFMSHLVSQILCPRFCVPKFCVCKQKIVPDFVSQRVPTCCIRTCPLQF